MELQVKLVEINTRLKKQAHRKVHRDIHPFCYTQTLGDRHSNLIDVIHIAPILDPNLDPVASIPHTTHGTRHKFLWLNLLSNQGQQQIAPKLVHSGSILCLE